MRTRNDRHTQDVMREYRPYKPFTAEMLMWLIENYRDTSNAELAKQLGCSVRTMQRRMEAVGIGLGKSDAFLAEAQKKAVSAPRKNPPFISQSFLEAGKRNQFKKGHKMNDMLPEETKRRMKEARSKKMKENFRKDRLRLKVGLKQKTGLRVEAETRHVSYLRYIAKKAGYIIARASMEAYYGKDTNRNEDLERKAERLGYRFIPKHE